MEFSNTTGEPQAIEKTRETYLNYLTLDRKIRDLIAQNQLQDATKLDVGDSDVAFNQFIVAVEAEKKINVDWFVSVQQTVEETLPSHRLLFGLGGYVLVIVLISLGVYHRYREL